MSTSRWRDLYRSVRPRSVGQAIVGILLVVLFVGGWVLFGVVKFGTASLVKGFDNNVHAWSSGPLVVDEDKGAGRCVVRPDSGPSRTIDREDATQRTVVEPWFEGSGRVECGWHVKVWTGSMGQLAAIVLSPFSTVGFVVGTIVLVLAYLFTGPKPVRRSQ